MVRLWWFTIPARKETGRAEARAEGKMEDGTEGDALAEERPETMTAILPVVLAGGMGTRLWPLSRELMPKQFLRLTGEHSMMQQTLLRLRPLEGVLPPCIVCNEAHRFLVTGQCREIGQAWGAILLEGTPRGTAPAIALAACHALAKEEDPALLVLPADHHVASEDAFRDAVRAGLDLVETGALATFGVRPTRPDTGYGYIRAGAAVEGSARSIEAHRIEQFVEKPERTAAQSYLASGHFYWNSGIFLFKASAFAAELERHQPAMLECCRAAVASGATDLDFFRPGEAFERSPHDSIDYAVMEKTSNGIVVPLDAGWSDVGAWPALHEAIGADTNDNAITGDVVAVETSGSLVRAGHRLVVTLGVDRLVVVETADAVLVASAERAPEVKGVVRLLKERSRTEHHLHRRVYRPWGSYETVESGEGYLVKRISVTPGARLSMQMHRHRSEHWVVVRGTAHVTCDDVERTLQENESTYIPVGGKHRLHNPGPETLELIEVQIGSYIGEDDIVRFDDDFGRGRSD